MRLRGRDRTARIVLYAILVIGLLAVVGPFLWMLLSSVKPEGEIRQGTWLPADAPADLAVSTGALNQVISVSPADLVATVQAGTPLDATELLTLERSQPR